MEKHASEGSYSRFQLVLNRGLVFVVHAKQADYLNLRSFVWIILAFLVD